MDLNKLEALAKVATPGPYAIEPGCYDTCAATATEFPHGPVIALGENSLAYFGMFCETDAEFLAACTPERIRALIRVAKAGQKLQEEGWGNERSRQLLYASLRDLETLP